MPGAASEQVVRHTFGISFVTQRLVCGTKARESRSEEAEEQGSVFLKSRSITSRK